MYNLWQCYIFLNGSFGIYTHNVPPIIDDSFYVVAKLYKVLHVYIILFHIDPIFRARIQNNIIDKL